MLNKKMTINLLISKNIPLTWLTDFKASHIHTSIVPTYLDKLLATHGFLRWGWSWSSALRQSSQLEKKYISASEL